MRHLLIWIAVAGVVVSAPAAAVGPVFEGDVVSVVGSFLLVRSAGGDQVFGVERAGSFIGVGAVAEILEGDRVRVAWSGERNGVKAAETVEVAAPMGVSAALTVSVASLPALLSGSANAPILVDLRPEAAFGAGHLPGAISAPSGRVRDLGRLLGPARERQLLFYGERRLTREIVDAIRMALALGWRDVGYVSGGVREWDEGGRPLIVTPEALVAGLGGAALTILDIREREHALAGTIPGAISLPRSAWRWQQFTDGRTLPLLVLVSADGADGATLEAADQIRRWTADALMRRVPRIRILEGGWRGWSAGSRKVVRGSGVSTELVWALGPGEVAREDFLPVLQADPGPKGPFVVDVSNEQTAPAWGKSIPLFELVDRLGELPRDREILLYCRVGRQAEMARAILVKNGFRARFLNGTSP